ncbi:MAG: hypothetical protein Kow0068_22890 [Marinilabiliales bacterium]
MKKAFVYIIFSLILLSCNKDAGEGGTSSITGKLLVKQYTQNYTVLIDSFYAPDEDIYIIYGEDDIYGDNMKTFYDGRFRFDYLRKGNYTIYAYSEDTTLQSSRGLMPVSKEIEITKNGETFDIGDIVIFENIDMNDGFATIKGKVYAYDYNNDFTVFNGQYYAPDEDVFIIYENQQYYFDDVKTDYSGTYQFQNLPVGKYKVYAYSRDISGDTASGIYPVFKEIEITEKNQTVIVDDIIIIN